MNKSQQPIGVFDSGAGGLSVLSELVKELPNESFIYYADSANCPYGPKSPEKIIELTDCITRFLIKNNCKIVVVACNTATAAAIDYLRKTFPIPFIGMEPAVKPASINSKTRSIGILATAGTFKGKLYIETSRKYANDVNVCYQVGEGLVELVETGKASSEEAKNLLLKYVQPMIDCNIDHLVLGCTHYPFLSPLLKKILPNGIELIDPAPAVARQTKKVITELHLNTTNQNDSQITFYSSGSTEVIKNLVDSIESIKNHPSKKYFFDNFQCIA